MSQSQNSTDTQALLQSMLQRLKLQPGREGQAHLHTPVPITDASTRGQGGENGASNLQKVNNSPVNNFQFTNGTPSKEFGTSIAESNFGLKAGETHQPGHKSEVGRGLISFPSQKNNIDGDTGENIVLGKGTQPGITLTGKGHLFPSKSLKDADITSFERTDGERVSFGSSPVTRNIPPSTDAVSSMGPNHNQDQNQGFTPKVYMWSLKSTDVDTGGQENKVLHMGNGGLGALAESGQIVPSSQITANSSLRKKQRPSESKTRRWTQKIKERWRDRPGSFGKKGKEEGGTTDQKSEQGAETSLPNQVLVSENFTSTSNKDGERTLPSADSSGSSKTPPAHTAEESTTDGRNRSTSDFEFGLGTFSLLDEIVKGQEWAKFLNPNLSATSANQRPLEEPLSQPQIQPNPHNGNQSSGIFNQLGGGRNQWSFGSTEPSPATVFSMAQILPNAFQPVSMDVSEGKQQQCAHREDDQSEPMEDGHNQSDMQSGESGPQIRPPSSVESADHLHNSSLKSRLSGNRKRQHQSAERRDERLQAEKMSDGEEADRAGFTSSLSRTSSHAMDETGGSQHDNITPLHILNSHPTPLSPSSSNPLAPAPRGVLKHSISRDLESSMETVTKRRRVEENRRVHFSEQVVTIAPPVLDLDATDSEDDSGAEEDSVSEQEWEVEQPAIVDVAPVRRPALPAWIQALKRRNTGRKHR